MSPKTAPLTAVQVRADILGPIIEEEDWINAGDRGARAAIGEALAKREEEMVVPGARAAQCRRLFEPEPPLPASVNTRQHHAVLHRAITAREAASEWQDRLLADQRGKASPGNGGLSRYERD